MYASKVFQTLIILWSTIAIVLISVIPGYATQGLPNSAEFGYGARLDLWGEELDTALNLAAEMGLNWIAIDFSWQQHWPDFNSSPDFSKLDRAINLARAKDINVLLSIKDAPSWANSSSGPDPLITSSLIINLARMYVDTVLAIELFPGMNTYNGWQAQPNPNLYFQLLQKTNQELLAEGINIFLVTTLYPVDPVATPQDIKDIAFLEQLYQAGAKPFMPILGIYYPDLSGEPMSSPSDYSPLVLRHYEDIRSTMLKYNHSDGLIWISAFAWPSGNVNSPGQIMSASSALETQATWVKDALLLVKAQLYIGAAFFNSLNHPNSEVTVSTSLLLPGGEFHPAAVVIHEMSTGYPPTQTFSEGIGDPILSATENQLPNTSLAYISKNNNTLIKQLPHSSDLKH